MAGEKNRDNSPELRDTYASQNNRRQFSPRCAHYNSSSKVFPRSFPTIAQYWTVDKNSQLPQSNVQLHMKLRIASEYLPASGIWFSKENFLTEKEQKQHSTFLLRKEMKNNTTAWQLLEVSREHESLLYSWRYLMKPAKKFIQIITHSREALGKVALGTLSWRLHCSRPLGTNPATWWIKAEGLSKHAATHPTARCSFRAPCKGAIRKRLHLVPAGKSACCPLPVLPAAIWKRLFAFTPCTEHSFWILSTGEYVSQSQQARRWHSPPPEKSK